MTENNKIRVLLLSKDLSFQGGVVNFVAMLVRHFSASIGWQHLRVGQVLSDQKHLTKLLYPIMDNVRLAHRVRGGNIDCIHINPSLNLNALLRDGLFMLTLRIFGFRKVLVFIHGWDEPVAARLQRSSSLGFLFRTLYGRSALIVVLAANFKDQLVKMGFESDRIRITTTMFDGSVFDGLEKRVHDGFGRTLLFLSRFVREKGVYELLEAFIGVVSRFPKTRLIMAGDGPERQGLQEWVNANGMEERIVFPGYLRNGNKARALLDADLFVLPTYSEGCPVALLEAMAAGLPVVTTAVGGIGDIFEDGRNGVLLDAITPKAIENAVVRLLTDPELGASISKNNRVKAWSNFEAGVVTANLEKLYREVAQHG